MVRVNVTLHLSGPNRSRHVVPSGKEKGKV
ncbi:hypothetical protein E2C01_060759 [Portunus trituberculatus]|uniref:Uncharacterized protein n=1 Tax=Portunus trituberculatus TaxID=210409 RepID=A0A5B7HCC4_PORTR|nr:hypothetical protein [Portunus trituberculatus]